MRRDEPQLTRESNLQLNPGLYVLKYEARGAQSPAPAAYVRPTSGFESDLDMISPPDVEEGQLATPGSCLVLRARRHCSVSIYVRRASPRDPWDASFQLDALATPVASATGISAPVERSSDARRFDSLKLLAHVALKGDVGVSENEWCGGPEMPAAIEGLQLRSVPQGVRIDIQPLLATRPPQWGTWVPSGEFAGTRGRSLPLAGFRIRFESDDPTLELAADALFLGSAVQSRAGRSLEFVSSGGFDPLVGLRVALRAKEAFKPGEDWAGASSARPPMPRVRVFRAGMNKQA